LSWADFAANATAPSAISINTGRITKPEDSFLREVDKEERDLADLDGMLFVKVTLAVLLSKTLKLVACQ
jgi:hypothetical protein